MKEKIVLLYFILILQTIVRQCESKSIRKNNSGEESSPSFDNESEDNESEDNESEDNDSEDIDSEDIESEEKEDKDDHYDISELRYVAFGTSRTVGSGMEHPEQAYLNIISNKKGTNLAIGGSNAAYPSMCVQSMIQDKIYDVIIIEYDKTPYNSVNLLVERLRIRFPSALIIMTQLWTIEDMVVKYNDDASTTTTSLRNRLMKGGHHLQIKPAIYDYIKNEIKEEIQFWNGMERRNEIIKQIAHKHNAILYKWDTTSKSPRELLLDRVLLFADSVHFNDDGHALIARELQRIIARHAKTIQYKEGHWGDGDFCVSWLNTGYITNQSKTLQHSSYKAPIELFDSMKNKYAMEFTESKTKIIIYNPLQGPSKLHLNYMTSFPNRMYPITKVKISSSRKENIIIDPVTTNANHPVHVQSSREIGVVQPGKNVITFEEVEETEFPFRLVGFAITNAGTSKVLVLKE